MCCQGGKLGVHTNNAALNAHTHCSSVRAHPSLIVQPLWVFTRSSSADTFTRTSIRLLLTNQTTKTLSIMPPRNNATTRTSTCAGCLSAHQGRSAACTAPSFGLISVHIQYNSLQNLKSHYGWLFIPQNNFAHFFSSRNR